MLPPVPAPEPLTGEGTTDLCTGHYLDIRTNVSTPERLMTLLAPVEVEPLVYRNAESPELLVFHSDSGGHVRHMFRGNNPTTAYSRLSWVESPTFQRGVVVACLAVFASVLLLWPVGFLFNILRRKDYWVGGRFGGTFLWLLSLAYWFFMVRLYGILSGPGFAFGLPPGMNTLLLIPMVSAGIMVALLIFLFLAWRRGYWTLLGRVHFTLAVAASVVMVLWTDYWNLLGYQFR